MRSGKPPGLVEISSWPYFTFLAAYAVEEVEARTNAIAIRPITAALIEIELGRRAHCEFSWIHGYSSVDDSACLFTLLVQAAARTCGQGNDAAAEQ